MIPNATILVDIKASLRSNNWLLEANLTQRAAKIVVLDGCAYPELRLIYAGSLMNLCLACWLLSGWRLKQCCYAQIIIILSYTLLYF